MSLSDGAQRDIAFINGNFNPFLPLHYVKPSVADLDPKN